MEKGKRWITNVKNFAFNVASMQIPVYAANACYFLMLSIFPVLLLILASLRYTSVSANDLIDLVARVLPSALVPAVESLIVSTYYNSSGTLVSVSAVAALWSASRGIYGLITGLNHIYGVHEDRSYVYTRGISVVYTFVVLIMLVMSLVLDVFGQSLISRIDIESRPLMALLAGIIDWKSLWLLVVQILVFTLIYMVLPNRRNRFLRSLPGAIVAAVGWQGFSALFSIYVELMLDGYTNIYGSIYTIAIGMLWIYWCMCILLFGGVLNRILQPRYLQ